MEAEDDSKEVVRPRIARNPGQPTQQEREAHNVTHIPIRSWCVHCMRGRGKDCYHKRLANSNEVPRIGMDYMFLTERGGGHTQQGASTEGGQRDRC